MTAVGTEATVLSSDSLPESSQWGFASWKRPVATEYNVPTIRLMIFSSAMAAYLSRTCLSNL